MWVFLTFTARGSSRQSFAGWPFRQGVAGFITLAIIESRLRGFTLAISDITIPRRRPRLY